MHPFAGRYHNDTEDTSETALAAAVAASSPVVGAMPRSFPLKRAHRPKLSGLKLGVGLGYALMGHFNLPESY